MIHARNDYNRIQDPAVDDPSLLSPGSTPIGADEPVFLIRGRDFCAFAALMAWAAELESHRPTDPASAATAAHVRLWANRMFDWAEKNGGKVPDAPLDQLAAF